MTKDRYVQLPWAKGGWLVQVSRWVRARLAERAWPITGPLEILHQRAWSAFARVPTANGTVYFKAPAPMFAYEAALTQALAGWRPDCTAPVVAIEPERGWLLAADAGPTLRSVDGSAGQIAHWLRLMPVYAELQIEMAEHAPELLALGMFDRRLAHLPRLYAELIEAAESLRVGLSPGVTHEEYQRLGQLRGRVAEWCAELASYGLPETLVHEEVHDANVLVSGQRYIFVDWSDSSIAHPFFSPLVTIRAAAYRLGLAEDGPELTRVRDAYLEPWTTLATRGALLAAFHLAYRLAMINRALSWHHGAGQLAPEHKEPYADSVPGWLQDFLLAATAAHDPGRP